MAYRHGCHTTFHHRYHFVWALMYVLKLLVGDVDLRVRKIIRQVCDEMGVTIINGALSRDHVRLLVEILQRVSVSDFVRPVERRSSRKIQQGGPTHLQALLRQRLRRCGYFSTTSGNITDDIIIGYLDKHTHKQGCIP